MHKLPKYFKEGLACLDAENTNFASHLKLVSDLSVPNSNLTARERFFLEKAHKLKANAVYFYDVNSDHEKTLPQVYLYDFEVLKNHLNDQYTLAHLHRDIWSSSEVRMYIIFSKDDVKIYNSSKPVLYDARTNEIKTPSTIEQFTFADKLLKGYNDKLRKFSFYNIDNGIFWDNLAGDFNDENSVFSSLITQLRVAKRKLLEKVPKKQHTLFKKLIVTCIFIKYLEEKREDRIRTVFPAGYFEKKYASTGFIDLIGKGKLVDFLNELKVHFNGDVFFFTQDEEDSIRKIDFTPLVCFLSGRIENEQLLLWNIYSFQHLPIELISSIYEDFIEDGERKKNGSFYTPIHLVNLMIDDMMPLSASQKSFKVIDPACGSGVFLVSAFKRLVEWWRISKYEETGIWIKPTKENLEDIKLILKKNIFGVDRAKEAVDVAIFSLCLCLCEMLSPEEIWNNLRFVNLEKNILNKDFFDFLNENENIKYDLVIGNPPFVELDANECASIQNKFSAENFSKITIPRKNSALLFLGYSINLIKKDHGKLCLLMPAAPLIYNNDSVNIEFRKFLFLNYSVEQIIDFSKLNDVLFGSEVNVPVCAITMRNAQQKNTASITHIVAQRLFTSKSGMYFEFDHYDFHEVALDLTFSMPYIWKANYLGGGRIVSLLNKLSSFETLDGFLNKKKACGWTSGEGFAKGEADQTQVDLTDIICGQPYLDANNFIKNNPEWKKIISRYSEDNKFTRIRERCRYEGPMLLIKKSSISEDSGLVHGVYDNYLTYSKSIFGINCPKTDVNDLKRINQWLIDNRKLIYFYLMATSSSASITRSSSVVKTKEIRNLPFSIDDGYSLTTNDLIVIDNALEELKNIPQRDVTIPELKSFGKLYSSELNKIYKDRGFSYKLTQVIKSSFGAICSFKYTDSTCYEEHIVSSDQYASLLKNSIGTHSIVNRVAICFDENIIHVLKPNLYSYWRKSIALRDADETLNSLFKEGY